MNTEYERFDLKYRIHDQYGTVKAFAEIVGINPRTLAGRLNGRTEFNGYEIGKIADALKLSRYELNRYFFTTNEANMHKLVRMINSMTDDQFELLKTIMDLSENQPERRKYSLTYTGEMKDLPAALAQI